jgi:hypothetical protein
VDKTTPATPLFIITFYKPNNPQKTPLHKHTPIQVKKTGNNSRKQKEETKKLFFPDITTYQLYQKTHRVSAHRYQKKRSRWDSNP